jgi:hypothetical protein
MIAVIHNFDYWGDNGRYTDEGVAEGETEDAVVAECCDIAARHDMGFKVERIYGATDAEALTARINAAVIARSASDKVKAEIQSLERSIAENQKWLGNVEAEKSRRLDLIEKNNARLLELRPEVVNDNARS